MSATFRYFFHGVQRAWDLGFRFHYGRTAAERALRRDWIVIGDGLFSAMADVRRLHPDIDWSAACQDSDLLKERPSSKEPTQRPRHVAAPR